MLTRSFFTPHASRAALMIPIGAAAAYIATHAVDIASLQSGLLLTLAATVGVRGVLTPWGRNAIFVIAPPPGRGQRSVGPWLAGTGIYAAAMVAGALFTGAMLYIIGRIVGQPPPQLVGIVAFLCAAAAAGLAPLPIPASTWALPQRWSRFGHTTYAVLFGWLLGLGLVTVPSSIGLYVLVAYGLTAPQLVLALLIFLVFGFVRAIPLLVLSLLVGTRHGKIHEALGSTSRVAQAALPAEIALLTAVGTLSLMLVY